MRSQLNYKPQQGITLIEVLVSLLIFSVGMLGMSALQIRVLKQTQDQRQRDVAIWRAQALVDRITINNSVAAIDRYITNISNPNFCATAPAVICAETYDSTSAIEVAAAVCTETQLATYDSWEVLCTDGTGINDELANLQSSLVCEGGASPCTLGNNLTIELTWDSHASTADPRLIGKSTIIDGDTGTVRVIDANLERYRQVFIP